MFCHTKAPFVFFFSFFLGFLSNILDFVFPFSFASVGKLAVFVPFFSHVYPGAETKTK